MARIARRLTLGRIFRRHGGQGQSPQGQSPPRWASAIFYRLAFVPIVLALLCWAMVFRVTHPNAAAAASDPLGQGMYFETVNVPLSAALPMSAWFVPVLDAQRVLEQKDKALRERFPAVVLAHDFGKTRSELLALVRPLHDAGMVVLLPALRGSEVWDLQAQTFGLREASDLGSAIDMLRTRAGIDAMKIAIVGTGSGANAARIVAKRDKFIAAAVLDRPIQGFEQAFDRELQESPLKRIAGMLRPGLRWTFEIMYGVDAEELREPRSTSAQPACEILNVDSMSTDSVEKIVAFLTEKLGVH